MKIPKCLGCIAFHICTETEDQERGSYACKEFHKKLIDIENDSINNKKIDQVLKEISRILDIFDRKKNDLSNNPRI